jgi:hypothetical protein
MVEDRPRNTQQLQDGLLLLLASIHVDVCLKTNVADPESTSSTHVEVDVQTMTLASSFELPTHHHYCNCLHHRQSTQKHSSATKPIFSLDPAKNQ